MTETDFQTQCCLMQVKILQHSAILSTFLELPVVIKTFVLTTFEWPLYMYTGSTVGRYVANWVRLGCLMSTGVQQSQRCIKLQQIGCPGGGGGVAL